MWDTSSFLLGMIAGIWTLGGLICLKLALDIWKIKRETKKARREYEEWKKNQ